MDTLVDDLRQREYATSLLPLHNALNGRITSLVGLIRTVSASSTHPDVVAIVTLVSSWIVESLETKNALDGVSAQDIARLAMEYTECILASVFNTAAPEIVMTVPPVLHQIGKLLKIVARGQCCGLGRFFPKSRIIKALVKETNRWADIAMKGGHIIDEFFA